MVINIIFCVSYTATLDRCPEPLILKLESPVPGSYIL